MSFRQLCFLILFAAMGSCGETNSGPPSVPEPLDIAEEAPSEDIVKDAEEDTYSMWTDPCVECAWYFCPPMNAVWQQQLCFNNCEDPPTLIYKGECEEYLECDPTQPIIETELDCTTDEGLPGTQDKLCSKGKIQYTDCVTACVEEICDGTDNDCDGFTDEGFDDVEELCNNIDDNCNGVVDEGEWECDEGCGSGPNLCVAGEFICLAPLPQEEVCDGIDNDCDGEVDEGQLNDCGSCGLLPVEQCNGIDDDCNGIIDDGLMMPCSTVCGEGFEVCVDGNWVSCNAPPAFDEICNGLDDDCDGKIDEDLECVCTIQDVGTLFPCTDNPLVCGQGFKTCVCKDATCEEITTTPCYAPCYWMAQPPGSDPTCDETGGMPIPEKCNNFDDNCNLIVDEDLFTGCYTGPEGTVGVGICLPGEYMCEAGTWGNIDDDMNLFVPSYCKGEITPQNEICDGVDNDCDGIVDYGNELKETDILFIVDWSGSMDSEIDAVLIALNQFAATYSDEELLQWGTILGPRKDQNFMWGNDVLELFQNLSPFSDFLSAMSSLKGMQTGGGVEMLLDAIYLAIQNIAALMPVAVSDLDWHHYSVGESIPHHDDFLIDWRPDAEKIIILFSDEKPQSYLKTDSWAEIIPEDVIAAAQSAPKLKIYVFSTDTSWKWDEISDATGGAFFFLTDNPADMYNSLMEILDEICKE